MAKRGRYMPLTITRRKLMMAMSVDLSCGSGRDKVVRLVSVNPETMQQLPVIAAEEMKYFRQQGVDVQVESLPSSARAMQALLGGSADVVSTLFDQLILMAAANRGVRSFLLMQRCPMLAVVVSPVTRKPITRMLDLKGRTIGVTSPGSGTHLQLNYMLSRSGVKASEVSIVGLGQNAARVAALEAGKVDAAILGDPGATLLHGSRLTR
jgi:NitT/TauT family transport system substrate-binding protein